MTFPGVPPGIRDRDIKDTLTSIVDYLKYGVVGGGGGGTGNTTIISMARPPSNEVDTGSEGSLFHDTSQNNLWIFSDNNWEIIAGLDIDEEGKPIINGIPQGYPLRYLDTAYATSADGDNFSETLEGISVGTERWQGLRNTTSTMVSTSPTDFRWRQIELAGGGTPENYSFTITGDVTVVSSGNLNLTNLLIDGEAPTTTNTFNVIPGTVFQSGARTFTINEARIINGTAETWVAGDWTDSASGGFPQNPFNPVQHAREWGDLPRDLPAGSAFTVTDMLVPIAYTDSGAAAPLYIVTDGGFFGFYAEDVIVDDVLPADDGTNGAASGLSANRDDTGNITDFRLPDGTPLVVTQITEDNFYRSGTSNILALATTSDYISDTNYGDLTQQAFLYNNDLFTGFVVWDGSRWTTSTTFNNSAYYRASGGRLIDWQFAAAAPANYRLDSGVGVIDLEDITSGITGLPGVPGPGGTDGVDGTSNRFDIAYFDDVSGSNPSYPIGTLTDLTYTPAERGTRGYQGTNVVTWRDSEGPEPSVSNIISDYEISLLVGSSGLSNRVDFAYANDTNGLNASYPSGTSSGDDYVKAVATTAHSFVGSNVVSWTAGETEPQPSTSPADYEWVKLTSEDGASSRVDISYATISSSPTPEVQTVSVSSLAAARSSSVSETTEVQALTYNEGTSNITSGEVSAENVKIILPNDFDSGPNISPITYSFTGDLGSVTNTARFTWSTETLVPVGNDWVYTPSTSESSSSGTTGGIFTYVSSTPLDARRMEIRVTINVTELPEDGTASSFGIDIDSVSGVGVGLGVQQNISALGEYTLVHTLNDSAIVVGNSFRVHFEDSSSGDWGMTFDITNVEFVTSQINPVSFSYDPDITNETFVTPRTLSLDFTNAELSSNLTFRTGGSYLTSSTSITLPSTSTPANMAVLAFSVMGPRIREDVSITLNSEVINITANQDIFTFWINTGFSTGDFGFTGWDVPPQIRVEGVIQELEENSPSITVDPGIDVVEHVLSANSNADSSLTQQANVITDLSTRISWDGEINDFSRDAVAGAVIIDYENAETEYNGSDTSLTEVLFGNWDSGGGLDDDVGESAQVYWDPEPGEIFANRVFNDLESRLSLGYTMAITGARITLSATTGEVTYYQSNISSGTTFNFDSTWLIPPQIRVLTPTPGDIAVAGDEEISGESIEIDFTNSRVSIGTSAFDLMYHFGNWTTATNVGTHGGYPFRIPAATIESAFEIGSNLNPGYNMSVGELVGNIFTPGGAANKIIIYGETATTLSIRDDAGPAGFFDFNRYWTVPPVVRTYTVNSTSSTEVPTSVTLLENIAGGSHGDFNYSWPTGTPSTVLDGWSYAPTVVAASLSASTAVGPVLRNNSDSALVLAGGTLSISMEVTSFPEDQTISNLYVRVLVGGVFYSSSRVDFNEINATTGTVEYTFLENTSLVVAPGDYISFQVVETTSTDRPFEYEISQVSFQGVARPTITLSNEIDTFGDDDARAVAGQTAFEGRSIELVHQTTDPINQSYTLTRNDSLDSNLEFVIQAEDVLVEASDTEPRSVYTVLDYAGTEVTAFTGGTTEGVSDRFTVLTNIINAINSNIETPIDFSAEDDSGNNRILLTAETAGVVTGVFSVTAEHSTGSGNLGFTASEITQGTDRTGTTSPTLIVQNPAGEQQIINIFGDTTSTVIEDFEDIARELRDNISFDAWIVTGTNNHIVFTSTVGGEVEGEFDITVQDLGTSGTTTDNLSDNDFTTVVTTEGTSIFSNVSYASGKTGLGNYSQAEPRLDSNYRGERTVIWFGVANEPVVSTDETDYQYLKYISDAEVPIGVRIDQSNGNVFRNGAGSTELTATVSVGNEDASDAQHSLYDYRWTYQGTVVCVADSTRQVLNDTNGSPLLATEGSSGLVCSIGQPADSTIADNLGSTLRRITVGAEDVNQSAQFVCDVSNI